MDKIRLIIKAIENEENDLLKQRSIETSDSAYRTTWLIISGSILAAILVSLANLIINQELTKRQRIEKFLQKAHDELESKVKERTSEIIRTNNKLKSEINEHKQTLETLAHSQKEFKAVVENTPDIIARFNRQLCYVYVNPAIEKITGILAQKFIGKTNIQLNLPQEICRIWDYKLQRVFKTGQQTEFESNLPTAWGTKHYHTRLVPELAKDSSVEFVLSIARDITALKQAEAKLIHDAFHDSLTGLPNRALFVERLERSLAVAKRHPDYRFAVLFLDVDRFKVVNDSLGHMIGDQLLSALARRLEMCLRAGDTVARIGGDEFTILLDDLKDLNDVINVVNRINMALTGAFNLSGHEVFSTISIGITLSTTTYNLAEELIRDADIAMYRAKALGKARHEIFDFSMYSQAAQLLQLEMDLRRAVERQEFQVHYQPIVSLETYKIIGFEALVRWQHPQHGLVSPERFISLAEETGLIVPIGYWVLREACRQMRAWQLEFPAHPPLTISVNISSKQFCQPNLIEQIHQILQDTGLEASSLKLEITETVLMENYESATAMLLQLQEMNIQLHLDDFGIGYSSLSYLHRFPSSALKIDRSFVINIGANGKNLEIVQAIISLAHSLNIDVIAEGVETMDQLRQLQIKKCKHAQGYIFSQPLDSQSVDTLIASSLPFKLN
ncbi:EAL domain-containing protein [Nostoc parmelioides FACHB-3921]|uniref:EAL domain-containing protein n=2 Tax=Nostoc TaxID=1177 RepID=A0ABR8B9I2_9NOSO|nr:EAL domain-containing protein [Nostoc parmelioides FACHB-3921]